MTTEAQDKTVSATQTTVCELTLLLLYLTRMGESLGKWLPLVWRSWKGYDFNALDTLEKSGFLSNSHRAKSVILTDEGIAEAKRLGKKYGVVRDMEENKLFPKYLRAVNALRDCCEDDSEIPPIARSEVYNETWMLRLTLALIHDSKLDFPKNVDKEKKEALNLMQSALQFRWISEGGLKPVFKNEGTTWVDAILGDVERRPRTKRGIKAVNEATKDSVGIVVVEAKMGSELASGISNSGNYDQAARNIACLARLVMDVPELITKSAFVVLAPDEKIQEWTKKQQSKKGRGAQTLIENALETISKETREKTIDSTNADTFFSAIEKICKQSVVLSWEEVIRSLDCEDEYKQALTDFYNQAKEEMKQVNPNLKDD